MKVVLICPSNLLYMPYVANYISILKKNGIDYTVINWDRFQIENNKNEFVYSDNKSGHKRYFLDYLIYRKFILKILKHHKFDKVIVFGLQLAFFLGRFLQKNFKDNYVVDIRDHNRIVDVFYMDKIIKNSALVVISSPGYKKFLPPNKEYIINHNTNIETIGKTRDNHFCMKGDTIKIGTIGALRDTNANVSLINTLKNNSNFELRFHGEGVITSALQEFIKVNSITNVLISGRFETEEEEILYKNCDFISVIYFNDRINNETFLPNRLYNAAKLRRPLIAIDGNYLSEQIKKYKIGVVIESLEQLEDGVLEFIGSFDPIEYENGIQAFLKMVVYENECFKKRLLQFCEAIKQEASNF